MRTRTRAHTHALTSMDELQVYVLMQHSEAQTPIQQNLNLLGTHRKPPLAHRLTGEEGGGLSMNLLR